MADKLHHKAVGSAGADLTLIQTDATDPSKGVLRILIGDSDILVPVEVIGYAGSKVQSVAANDNIDLALGTTKWLYVGAAGDVKVDMDDGSTATFTALAAGILHPLAVRRVYATGTTATGILAVY